MQIQNLVHRENVTSLDIILVALRHLPELSEKPRLF